jgi:hypothetical protein
MVFDVGRDTSSKRCRTFRAIAVRDLATYVDWRQVPDDSRKIIEQRKSALATR